MKPLVLYDSLRGNNKNLAHLVSRKLNCPSEQITEKSKRNMLTFFIEILFKKAPEFNDIRKNLKDYDHIILIAPLWMGVPAGPMISFLKKYSKQITGYSFISLCGGSLGPNKNLCSFLQNKMKKKPAACNELYINDIARNEDKGKPSKIMKIKVGADVIENKYNEKINEFLALIK